MDQMNQNPSGTIEIPAPPAARIAQAVSRLWPKDRGERIQPSNPADAPVKRWGRTRTEWREKYEAEVLARGAAEERVQAALARVAQLEQYVQTYASELAREVTESQAFDAAELEALRRRNAELEAQNSAALEGVITVMRLVLKRWKPSSVQRLALSIMDLRNPWSALIAAAVTVAHPDEEPA